MAPESPAAPEPAAAIPLSRFTLLLGGLVLVAAALLYSPTLGASYAYDDMDYLNGAADVLAGKLGFWSAVFHPHLEHLVPAVRLAFIASAALFGVSATPFRLAVLLSHCGAAFFIGLTARRHAGSAPAGFAAALAYVLPAGFSSMWIWLMTGAGVPFGLLGLTGCLAALAWRDRLGPRRAALAAAAGVLLTAASESTLAPLLLIPALLALAPVRPRRWPAAPAGLPAPSLRAESAPAETAPAGLPARSTSPGAPASSSPPLPGVAGRALGGALAGLCLAAFGGTLALSALLYRRVTGAGFHLDLVHGLPRSAFLALVAPYRYFFPGPSGGELALAGEGHRVPINGSLFGIAVAGGVLALVVLLWEHCPRPALRVCAACAAGSLAVLGLVGLGRAGVSFVELFDSDRYFFTLLLPISMLAASLAEAVRRSAAAWPAGRRRALALALVPFLGAECALHRHALMTRVPFAVFAQHEHRFEQLGRLTADLSRAARSRPAGAPPLTFPDSAIYFPDVHNGRISARLLLAVIGRGTPGVRLGSETIAVGEGRLLNPIFDAWAREIGEKLPYLSLQSGRLVNAHVIGTADFRTSRRDEAVVSGLSEWEGGYRWMGEHGVLRLEATSHQLTLLLGAPEQALRSLPGNAIDVAATLEDVATGLTVPLGRLAVLEGGPETFVLDASPLTGRTGIGRTVHLHLDAAPSWRPSDIFPGSRDSHPLTVRVFSAGF